MKIQIMSPIADKFDNKVPPARRLETLNGKTIGLYSNETGGSEVAVARVGERLRERYPAIRLERYGGPVRPGRPALSRGVHITTEEAARIAKEVDGFVGATAH